MGKKIAFILCVNNEQLYDECVKYIENLIIPVGITIEIIPIRGAKSIMQGYNMGMKKTDTKYKVYLHQDTFIINKNFIQDILEIFETDNNIGMLGVIGSKVIPTNAIWWEAKKKYGKVYNNSHDNMTLLEFDEIENKYEKVQAIDGLIMITQHDIEWREDIFDGWDFYDLSQCVEFIKVGYDVAIPRQEEPWCLSDNNIFFNENINSRNKESFLEEYSNNIFPLVSVLIPTYNRLDYFREALESVVKQTYRNIEIIIGDDGTNNETENLVRKEYLNKHSNIIYYHNKSNLGQFDNDIKLYNMANGKFINYLMDDDLFDPTKIEKMINYFIDDNNEEISIITSHRKIIDDSGNSMGVFGDTDRMFTKDTILDGIDVGNFILKTNFNIIGEPTTALFRKNKLIEPFGVLDGRKYGCNVDQAAWFNLLSNGKMVFINEALSFFRIHGEQQLNSKKMKLLGASDYAHEVLTSNKKGFLIDKGEFKKALFAASNYCKSVLTELDKVNNYDLYDSEIKQLKGYYKELKSLSQSINTNVFKQRYDNLPLVSILIPTYNQTIFLKDALESAINQTYPNIEIIIGDDSTNDEVFEFIKPYILENKNMKYFKNKRINMDYGISNGKKLLEMSSGRYVNYLFHDDIFHKDKISKMMDYFLIMDNISIVTSHRQLINEEREKLQDNNATKVLFEKTTLVDGRSLSLFCLKNMTNFIGEPTTVLFKKELLHKGFGYYNDNFYENIIDLSTWFSLLKEGDAVYISETLSYCRQHPNQNSQNLNLYLKGIVEWKRIIEDCCRTGLIDNETLYKNLLSKWFSVFSNCGNDLAFKDIDYNLRVNIYESYLHTLNKLMFSNHKYT